MGVLWQSDAPHSTLPASDLQPFLPSETRKPRHRLRTFLWLSVLLLLLGGGWLIIHELRTATLQSRELSAYAARLTYTLQAGPSDAIQFPASGPFDQRLGYAQLPHLLERLQQRGYLIQQQVHFSDALLDYSQRGFFPPFREKLQSGLQISDCRGLPLYQFRYPQQGYARFADIPPLIVGSLLFIENRHLLDPIPAQANPAVDWPRLGKAALSQVGKNFAAQEQSAGGSTLATQLEKYRHSPHGLTLTPRDKLLQMVSASVRAYQQGPETLPARQDIVRDYLNSVPLSAAPGHGEVHGLADGLRVWFGSDFDHTNALLANPSSTANEAERGLALRQVLALMIRGLALGQVGASNARTLLWKELRVALLNGVVLGTVLGLIVLAWFHMPGLSLVIAIALTFNLLFAASAGVLVPLTLKRLGFDPALASGIFLTAVTDSMGFFTFLGLATLVLLH